MQSYTQLPAYLSGWDVGWMPFARNDATRYISPTKTPEYLAAGLPVVSTSIADVIDPYQRLGLVEIADDVETTIAAVGRALVSEPATRWRRADAFLAGRSWDRTWAAMEALLNKALARPDRHEKRSDVGAIPRSEQLRAAASPDAASLAPLAPARISEPTARHVGEMDPGPHGV
jgi:UDP-galactopyranose mutase